MARLAVLTSEEVLSRLRQKAPPTLYAAYSSVFGGIVTDPALATVPLDDHGFHRGHAVFDTCNVSKGRAFGLSFHLDRLLRSAAAARITNVPSKEELRSTILQTIAATRKRDGVYVRYWLTAGHGDFSISPKSLGAASFFVAVHKDMHSAEKPRGLSAATITSFEISLKPHLLATMKSNNYLMNALVAMEAESRGANLGIQLNAEGELAESSVSAIAIVDRAGMLRSPVPQEAGILASTTWASTVRLALELQREGLLEGVREGTVRAEELGTAREIFSLGGGWVEPVTHLDGRPINGGAPGPVFQALDVAIRNDFDNPEHTDAIPFDSEG